MNYDKAITLDFAAQGCVARIEAKQGDAFTRRLIVTLKMAGQAFTVPEGVEVLLRVQKPDGTAAVNQATVNDNGTVTVILTDQILAAAGPAFCDLALIREGELLSTVCFGLDIQRMPNVENQMESSSEWLWLLEKLAQADEAARNAQEAAGSAGRSASDASAAKTAAQAAQSAAETAGTAAQGAASTATTKAGEAATSAANAAQSASDAEEAQGAAEEAQGAAETASSHYPYIGENRHWFVWDLSVGAFVDTGVAAGGQPGEPGKSAYQSAQDGGYTGTETQFNSDLAEVSQKQDLITDLATIRSGAAAGATAVQPEDIDDMATQTWVSQQGYDTAVSVDAKVQAVQDDVDDITEVISQSATATNKLVSASEMGDAISSVEAKQLYATASQGSFATKADLTGATTFYNADGTVATPTKNDVAYVLADESHSGKSAKYVIAQIVGDVITWGFVITFSDTTFTQSQMDAINSGATSENIAAIADKYVKPSGGIPDSDIASASTWNNKQSKSIADTGSYFTTDTVEGALQELGAELAGINTLLGTGVFS